ncbi:MAG: flavin reductase family protein [Nitrospirae bacterium]|nr:flavin reductase family protein [Nitrospirota bacterium]
MKLEKDIAKAGFYQYYPVVPAVVVIKSGDALDAMACAWHVALSFDPPLFGVAISPKRYSYKLLKKSGEFTANFLTFDNIGIIAAVGRTSGKDTDKFSEYKINTLPSSVIETPLLKAAYAAYECKVVKSYKTGDHVLFIGEILAIHQTGKAFDKKNRIPDLKSVTPALYLGVDHYIAIKSFGEVKVGKEEVMAGGSRGKKR